MIYSSREIQFDSCKIIKALQSVCSLAGSPEWNPASEIIDMIVAAACGDSTALESWELHCTMRNAKLNREQELRSITNLLTLILGKREDKDHSSDKIQNAARELRKNQLSKRRSECDGKATELAAMMPVPPLTLVWKGGQNIRTMGV